MAARAPQVKPEYDDAALQFMNAVVDIGNRDMSRVSIQAHAASIRGTHFKLPVYGSIHTELQRLYENRRMAMADLRWHAIRAVYHSSEGDNDRLHAALQVAANEVKTIDDSTVALKLTAATKRNKHLQDINHLKADMALHSALDANTAKSREYLEHLKTINDIAQRLHDAREQDIYGPGLYLREPVRILQSPPVDHIQSSPQQPQVGGGEEKNKLIARYQVVRDKIARRRWPSTKLCSSLKVGKTMTDA